MSVHECSYMSMRSSPLCMTARKPIFLLQDARVKGADRKSQYNRDYVPSIRDTKPSSEASLAVVTTEAKVKVRGTWETDQAVVHQFATKEDLQAWRDSGIGFHTMLPMTVL